MSSCGGRPDGAAAPTNRGSPSLLHLLAPGGLLTTYSSPAASPRDPDFLYNVMCEAERIADDVCRSLDAPKDCDSGEESPEPPGRSSSPAAEAACDSPSVEAAPAPPEGSLGPTTVPQPRRSASPVPEAAEGGRHPEEQGNEQLPQPSSTGASR
jgi:hypothetical protein